MYHVLVCLSSLCTFAVPDIEGALIRVIARGLFLHILSFLPSLISEDGVQSE